MIHDYYPNFGPNLRALRKSRNYTIFELAEKLGTSTNLIAMYEHGNRTPSLQMLSKISKIFDISIDELLGNSTTTKNINETFLGISAEEFNNLSDEKKYSIRTFIEFIKNS